jgi:hypothetical protein
VSGADMCHAGVSMRIGAIAGDTVKLECIIAWCASHPDEVPFVQHQLMGRYDKHPLQES